jgi:hypothetical protein
MSIPKGVKDEMLEYRKKNFEARVAPSRFRSTPKELVLMVTHNGHQWNSLSLMPHEAEAVVKVLSSAIKNKT